MKEKKNIDSLFKDRFQDIEASPSPRVWENIQAQLKKEKQDRKVIPLWIKLGGVAALLALLFTVGNKVFNSSDTATPLMTQEDIIKTEKKLQDQKLPVENDIYEPQVASEDQNLQNKESRSENASNISTGTNQKTIQSSDKKINRNVVAVEKSEKTSSEKRKVSKDDLINRNGFENDGNAQQVNESIASEANKTKNGVDESLIKKDKDISETNKDAVAIGISKSTETENKVDKGEVKATESDNKKSILDAIAEQNEEKEIIKKEKPENRWNVAPNVAPVYYSSLGNGSSIDPTFSDNPQKGEVNFSYGVQVSYALNDRLSVRTGISNMDLSYSTSGIEVGTGPVAQALRSVDYGGSQIVLTAVDKGALMNSSSGGEFDNITPKSTQGDARIIQNINYYEVPLELKYALLNNKFGVNIIGGLSTLFLGNNDISVKADNFNSVLGEANNLSTISFSTNVGLGLDYKLSKKFTFNIEPMFKYQLNPYTDSSVNFKPYYLGVYSGLSFKF